MCSYLPLLSMNESLACPRNSQTGKQKFEKKRSHFEKQNFWVRKTALLHGK